MEFEEENSGRQTKLCPFCAEVIQAAAVKCRYCGEFLTKKEPKGLGQNATAGPGRSGLDDRKVKILFKGKPSIFGLMGACLKGLVFFVIAAGLLYWPIEKRIYPNLEKQMEGRGAVLKYIKLLKEKKGIEFNRKNYFGAGLIAKDLLKADKKKIETEKEESVSTEDQNQGEEVWAEEQKPDIAVIQDSNIAITPKADSPAEVNSPTTDKLDSYRKPARIVAIRWLLGGVIGMLALAGLLLKVLKLKSIYYQVTWDGIEKRRGILFREVDSLDMFRVADIRLKRSILDYLLGIGRVELITTDKTDKNFVFEKMRRPRRLYDIIRKVSFEADRRGNVLHIDQ